MDYSFSKGKRGERPGKVTKGRKGMEIEGKRREGKEGK